jgi:phospholipid/cholesterol/gamma-HCH transport system substrate-binding protein
MGCLAPCLLVSLQRPKEGVRLQGRKKQKAIDKRIKIYKEFIMKISHEVKIGATALVTIVVFIWLYNFLKGKDLLTSTNHYYAVYNQINGLAESSPVEINGYRVGVVQSIDFFNDGTGRLLVTISVKKGFDLPQKTVAEITTASLIAGMKIRLVYGTGPGIYNNGDTIPGKVAESLISKFESELGPVKEKISGMISILDSVLTDINDIMSPEFRKDIKGSMANLNNTTKNIDEILGSKEAELKSMLADLSKFSKMLSDNSGKLGNTINNLNTISDTLAAADLYSTVMNLKTTLERTSQLMDGINNGKGTAGQLVTNDSLFMNMNNSIESLDLLLKDMKENPKRYVHFSIFGKKNQPAN